MRCHTMIVESGNQICGLIIGGLISVAGGGAYNREHFFCSNFDALISGGGGIITGGGGLISGILRDFII